MEFITPSLLRESIALAEGMGFRDSRDSCFEYKHREVPVLSQSIGDNIARGSG
jgi:hypothetical protein